jgi:hypothetical protein
MTMARRSYTHGVSPTPLLSDTIGARFDQAAASWPGLGMKVRIGCHTFRAPGITAYLEAGGTLEKAQAMAAHESPRATKLYDGTGDAITLDEVERITIRSPAWDMPTRTVHWSQTDRR